jgi:hypothetical protein
MKRTLLPRPVVPARLFRWPGVLARFDNAADQWSDVPHAEVCDLARRRPTAVAITAPQDGACRFSAKRPVTFSFWALAVWLHKRADRRKLRNATSQLCTAPDQVLDDIGVSRDEMLAKSMCPRVAGEDLDDAEPGRQ